jgi:hypothetical protein
MGAPHGGSHSLCPGLLRLASSDWRSRCRMSSGGHGCAAVGTIHLVPVHSGRSRANCVDVDVAGGGVGRLRADRQIVQKCEPKQEMHVMLLCPNALGRAVMPEACPSYLASDRVKSVTTRDESGSVSGFLSHEEIFVLAASMLGAVAHLTCPAVWIVTREADSTNRYPPNHETLCIVLPSSLLRLPDALGRAVYAAIAQPCNALRSSSSGRESIVSCAADIAYFFIVIACGWKRTLAPIKTTTQPRPPSG